MEDALADPLRAQIVNTLFYTYDSLGLLKSEGDNMGIIEYAREFYGRVSKETQHIPQFSEVAVLDRRYNQLGSTISTSLTVGGIKDFVNEYSYDGLIRTTRIVQHGTTGGNEVSEKRIDFSYGLNQLYSYGVVGGMAR